MTSSSIRIYHIDQIESEIFDASGEQSADVHNPLYLLFINDDPWIWAERSGFTRLGDSRPIDTITFHFIRMLGSNGQFYWVVSKSLYKSSTHMCHEIVHFS